MADDKGGQNPAKLLENKSNTGGIIGSLNKAGMATTGWAKSIQEGKSLQTKYDEQFKNYKKSYDKSWDEYEDEKDTKYKGSSVQYYFDSEKFTKVAPSESWNSGKLDDWDERYAYVMVTKQFAVHKAELGKKKDKDPKLEELHLKAFKEELGIKAPASESTPDALKAHLMKNAESKTQKAAQKINEVGGYSGDDPEKHFSDLRDSMENWAEANLDDSLVEDFFEGDEFDKVGGRNEIFDYQMTNAWDERFAYLAISKSYYKSSGADKKEGFNKALETTFSKGPQRPVPSGMLGTITSKMASIDNKKEVFAAEFINLKPKDPKDKKAIAESAPLSSGAGGDKSALEKGANDLDKNGGEAGLDALKAIGFLNPSDIENQARTDLIDMPTSEAILKDNSAMKTYTEFSGHVEALNQLGLIEKIDPAMLEAHKKGGGVLVDALVMGGVEGIFGGLAGIATDKIEKGLSKFTEGAFTKVLGKTKFQASGASKEVGGVVKTVMGAFDIVGDLLSGKSLGEAFFGIDSFIAGFAKAYDQFNIGYDFSTKNIFGTGLMGLAMAIDGWAQVVSSISAFLSKIEIVMKIVGGILMLLSLIPFCQFLFAIGKLIWDLSKVVALIVKVLNVASAVLKPLAFVLQGVATMIFATSGEAVLTTQAMSVFAGSLKGMTSEFTKKGVTKAYENHKENKKKQLQAETDAKEKEADAVLQSKKKGTPSPVEGNESEGAKLKKIIEDVQAAKKLKAEQDAAEQKKKTESPDADADPQAAPEEKTKTQKVKDGLKYLGKTFIVDPGKEMLLDPVTKVKELKQAAKDFWRQDMRHIWVDMKETAHLFHRIPRAVVNKEMRKTISSTIARISKQHATIDEAAYKKALVDLQKQLEEELSKAADEEFAKSIYKYKLKEGGDQDDEKVKQRNADIEAHNQKLLSYQTKLIAMQDTLSKKGLAGSDDATLKDIKKQLTELATGMQNDIGQDGKALTQVVGTIDGIVSMRQEIKIKQEQITTLQSSIQSGKTSSTRDKLGAMNSETDARYRVTTSDDAMDTLRDIDAALKRMRDAYDVDALKTEITTLKKKKRQLEAKMNSLIRSQKSNDQVLPDMNSTGSELHKVQQELDSYKSAKGVVDDAIGSAEKLRAMYTSNPYGISNIATLANNITKNVQAPSGAASSVELADKSKKDLQKTGGAADAKKALDDLLAKLATSVAKGAKLSFSGLQKLGEQSRKAKLSGAQMMMTSMDDQLKAYKKAPKDKTKQKEHEKKVKKHDAGVSQAQKDATSAGTDKITTLRLAATKLAMDYMDPGFWQKDLPLKAKKADEAAIDYIDATKLQMKEAYMYNHHLAAALEGGKQNEALKKFKEEQKQAHEGTMKGLDTHLDKSKGEYAKAKAKNEDSAGKNNASGNMLNKIIQTATSQLLGALPGGEYLSKLLSGYLDKQFGGLKKSDSKQNQSAANKDVGGSAEQIMQAEKQKGETTKEVDNLDKAFDTEIQGLDEGKNKEVGLARGRLTNVMKAKKKQMDAKKAYTAAADDIKTGDKGTLAPKHAIYMQIADVLLQEKNEIVAQTAKKA